MFQVVNMSGDNDEQGKQFREALSNLDPTKARDFFFFICMFIDMLNTQGHTAELRIGENGFYLLIDGVESGRFTPKDPQQPINALFRMLEKASHLPHAPFIMQAMQDTTN